VGEGLRGLGRAAGWVTQSTGLKECCPADVHVLAPASKLSCTRQSQDRFTGRSSDSCNGTLTACRSLGACFRLVTPYIRAYQ